MRKKANMKTLLLTLLILSSGWGGQMAAEPVPEQADDIRPILIGQKLPQITLRTPENEPIDLNAEIARKPTVLIFYRGGWCPFCNMHLGRLQTIESNLIELGCQIIAVSPDRPALLKAAAAKHSLNYRLLSQ